MRHRYDPLMIWRNDYFKPPLAMSRLVELFFFFKGLILEVHIVKNFDQHMFQIPMSNDENHALNRNINPDNDSTSFTSSEIKKKLLIRIPKQQLSTMKCLNIKAMKL